MPHEPTLLCLDDQQTPLFIRKMVLETRGFQVLTATTGQSPFQQMAEHHVDLVIADHLLRDTTGTEIAKEMKKRWPNVPIILVSRVIDVPDDLQG
jgi:DNA-binding response OmpR family regulator